MTIPLLAALSTLMPLPVFDDLMWSVARGLPTELVKEQGMAKSTPFNPAEFDVSTDRPLRIGFGQADYFAGRMADVRIYNQALAEREIETLASKKPR